MEKLYIAASFIFSLLLVLITLKISHKKAWYDRLDERKIHSGEIPRLGGIGFSLVFIAAASLITLFAREAYLGAYFIPPLIAMVLISSFGIFDDFRPIPARYKLFLQFSVALCIIIPDYTFHRLFFFDIGPLKELNWIRYPLSFLWVVGLTNAINFIDGVDGLAGGISFLAALTYAAIFSSFNNTGSVTLLCICLAAAIGGFLVFNMPFPEAKIFMGDGGSQFLGFTLAFLPLIDKGNTRSDLPFFHAAALLLIPLLDTLGAIIRRIREGRRIDSPDKFHIHHKLMYLGLGARGVIAVLWGLQILLSVFVFLSVKAEGMLSLIALGTAYFLGFGFFTALHYINRAVIKERGLKVTDTAT